MEIYKKMVSDYLGTIVQKCIYLRNGYHGDEHMLYDSTAFELESFMYQDINSHTQKHTDDQESLHTKAILFISFCRIIILKFHAVLIFDDGRTCKL